MCMTSSWCKGSPCGKWHFIMKGRKPVFCKPHFFFFFINSSGIPCCWWKNYHKQCSKERQNKEMDAKASSLSHLVLHTRTLSVCGPVTLSHVCVLRNMLASLLAPLLCNILWCSYSSEITFQKLSPLLLSAAMRTMNKTWWVWLQCHEGSPVAGAGVSVGQQAGRGRVQGEEVLCTMLKRAGEPKAPLRTQLYLKEELVSTF